MVDEEIEEIKKQLENETGDFAQDQMYDQWEKAHDKYDNGEKDMLTNMFHQKAKEKALDYKGFMSSKGQYLDYNEWHTTSWSGGLIFGAYTAPSILSGIFLTAWLYVLIIIGKHSWQNCKGREHDHWIGSFEEFGFELPYYGGTAVVMSYLLEHHTQYTIAVESMGFMQAAFSIVTSVFGGA